LDVPTGAGFRPRAAQKTHRYTGDGWQTTQASLAEAGLITVGDDDVIDPFALSPYDLPVGGPRGFRPGDENPYLVAGHGTRTTP
ncbi:hypothetical protein R0J89_20140, partial [Psychrobacter sp. SIMBA_152]